ncbi:hypothetical protein [Nocardiopsis sp. MG754419]|uniref:hypothetical protein n=1 Tax=Nocardiopsis sp. MG754419 TaxID=2259865 RepID=UPI001BA79532|nr:hypothetical protein [Nocardiopsis sp. MG754419]MBR8744384.1 hypothetical protein [Nocardiopsis sp. MG754419]
MWKLVFRLHVLGAVLLAVTSALQVFQGRPWLALMFGVCALTSVACSVVWAVTARHSDTQGSWRSTGRHSRSSSVQ